MKLAHLSRIAAAFALVTATAAHAELTVKDAWVRATVAQQKATGAFMTLTASSDLRLVKAESAAAGVVEVHEMAMEGDVMRMRAVPALALPAGKAVELKPGGYHVMLMALKKPLQAGDTVPMTLVLEGKDQQRQTVEIQAPVRAMNAAPAMEHKHGMEHKH